jgi:hypothetical protein
MNNNFEITHDKEDFVTVAEMAAFRTKNKKDFSTISNKRFNDMIHEVFKTHKLGNK